MPSLQSTLGLGKPRDRNLVEDEDLEFEESSNFARGLSAGIDQTQALGGGLKAWLGSVVGSEEMMNDGLTYYEEQMAEAGMNAGDVMRIEDIDGLGSFTDYIAYQAGAFLPSLATSIAGGGVGGFVAKKAVEKKIKNEIADRAQDFAKKRVKSDVMVAKRKELERKYVNRASSEVLKKATRKGQAAGAMGTGAAMFTGETTGAIYDETGEISPGVALAAGIVGGSLDALVGLRALRKILPEGKFRQAKEVIGDTIGEDPKRFNQVMNAIKKSEIGKQAPIEGVTEAMQEYVQEVAIKYVDGNYSDLAGAMAEAVTQEGALSLYTNAAAAGAVGGAVSGAFTDAGRAGVNKFVLDDKPPNPKIKRPPEPPNPDEVGGDLPDDREPVTPEEQILRNLRTRQQVRAMFEAQTQGELDLGDPVLGESTVDTNEQVEAAREEMEGEETPDVDRDEVLLDMDDLPFPVQRQFMMDAMQAGETSMPEQVSIRDAMDKVNSVPDADPNQLTLDIENTAEKAIALFRTPNSKTRMNPEQTGPLDRTRYANGPWATINRTDKGGFFETDLNVEEAIRRHNNLVGTDVERVGVTDTYVPELLDPEKPFAQNDHDYVHSGYDYKSVPVKDAPKGDQDAFNVAMVDLMSAGLPPRVLNYVNGFNLYDRKRQRRTGVMGFYVPFSKNVSIDTYDLKNEPGVARNTIVHELGHALDYGENITFTDENWDVKFSEKTRGKLDIEMSDIMAEAYDAYVGGGTVGTYFRYPFSMAYEKFMEANRSDLIVREVNIDSVMDFLKKEVFAQSFALYVGNPKMLAESMPKMYDYMNELAKKEASDVETNQNAGEALSEFNARPILREVQSSATSRDLPVGDDRGDGQGSRAGTVQEQASEGMGGTETTERDGRGPVDSEIVPLPEPPPAEGDQEAVAQNEPQAEAPADPPQEATPEPAPEPAPRTEEDEADLNARIKEKNKFFSIKNAKKFLRRQLAPGGLLPESAFKLKIERDSELGAVEIDIGSLLGEFDKAVRQTYGKNPPEEVTNSLNEGLQDLTKLDKLGITGAVKESVVAMRSYLDNMSVEYAEIIFEDAKKLMEDGKNEAAMAKAELLETIVGNLGQYVNRSYRAFDDPKWSENVPDDVLNAARSYLESRGSTNVELVINELLKDGTAYDSMESMIKESMLGAKDLSILKQRKDIAPEIRALLGEYTDARVNFGRSATKMSRLLFNERFLRKIKEDGMGVYLFNREDAPADSFTTFAPDGSSAMAPLSGLKTTPEIHQAFKDALDKEQMSDWYRTIVRYNGMVKFGKTVIAPTTIARNYMSAMMFAVANGHFNMGKAADAWDSKKAIFRNEGSRLEYIRRLKQLGVIYDAPFAGEMMKLLEESKFETIQTYDIGKKMGETANYWGKKLTSVYQYGDDFWKIIGFENEIDILMANKGISREQAEPLAAERIRNTYPTYSMVGKAGTWLRRFPLAGTFVSFPAEIIRTSFNMLRYLKQDMEDPQMRATVPRRVAGLAMASAGAYALTEALRNMLDVDDDEDEAVRLLAPPWSQNSNIAYVSRSEDGLSYIDLSALDPYSYFKRPLNAIMRDQPLDDAVVQAAGELLAPFFGRDIAFGAIAEIWQNEKESGAQVYNESDLPANQLADITGHFLGAIQPGFIGNADRLIKAVTGDVSPSGRKYKFDDELAALVGFRASTVDPKIALYYKAYEFNDVKRQSTNLLRSTFRSINDVSDGELQSAYENSSQARKEAFERMAKIVEATRRSGLTNAEIRKVLRSNGITLKDATALINGDITKYKISDSTLKSSIKRADFLTGDSTSAEFQRRYKFLLSLEEE